jgi:hypothetical protein
VGQPFQAAKWLSSHFRRRSRLFRSFQNVVTDPLKAALERIEGIRVEPPAPERAGAVAYSWVDDLVEDPRARLEELLDQLWRRVSKYADVQTSAARTSVGWSGSVRSAVSSMADPKGLEEHSLTVASDLAKRTQWLRILIASTAVATSVAAASANPAAVPAAFRAGWKLVGELKAVLNAPIT